MKKNHGLSAARDSWPWRILLAEDNPADVTMVRRSLRTHAVGCELFALDDGQDVFRFIDGIDSDCRTPAPDLVLLDLNLPHRSGLEILRKLRASERCGLTPVIVMTGSDSPAHLAEAEKNAHHYFRKTADSFMKIGGVVRQVLEAGSRSNFQSAA
jgi:two-component system, chemotaxis family, response regulator Rcp1